MWDKPLRVFTRFDETASTEETNHFLGHLSLLLCDRISDPSLKTRLGILLRGRHLRELCETELPYGRLSHGDAFNAGQILAFFKKREDLDLGVDKEAAASEKFSAAESLCRETNAIFRLRSKGEFQFSPRVEAVLFTAQRKISRILGDVPTLRDLKPRLGPGASTTIKKADSCARNKLGAEMTASSELFPFLSEILAETPGWTSRTESGAPFKGAPPPSVREDVGVVEFVPKSWKTDRAIVKEPMLNAFWQLGIGDYIAARLSRSGCDLRVGQTLNRLAAKRGSFTGELATLDLSSASDTVSKGIVFDLLPFEWSDFLRKFRTGRVRLGGAIVEQQKFSSMGNGFTFPLETLLFYALASSCSEECYVFGDDIIVRTCAVGILKEVLAACGFLVNHDKSFTEGPFRESCGGDYQLGIDVRPCFVKNRFSCRDAMVLHNFFAARYDTEMTVLIRRRLAPFLQLEGPAGYGDGYLHVAEPKLRPKGRNKGWAGFCFDTFVDAPRRSIRISRGDYVLPSYSVYVRDDGGLMSAGTASPNHREVVLSSVTIPLPRGGRITAKRSRFQPTEPSPDTVFYHEGRLQVTLPGAAGYKRITIYLLHHP
jgi:hypothetical protein